MQFYEIDFLEAGEKGSGDAIAIRYREDDGTDYVHVVDGGYTDDGQKLVDHIRKYYDDPSIIDHVVLTHPDGDHAAGLKTVLEEFVIGALWMNRPWNHVQELTPLFEYEYTEDGLIQRLKKDFPNTAELEEIAMEKGIQINDAFQGKIGAFEVLAPSKDRYIELVVDSEKTPEAERKAKMEGSLFERVVTFVQKIAASWGEENLKGESDGTSSENEMSVVQIAELCNEKILLTGDAGIEALQEAYDNAALLGYSLPGVNRFQVPHHGSRRNLSSTVLDNWLGQKLPQQTDSPSYSAIISANQNDDDHPKKAVVRALHHRGAKVVQTKGILFCYKNAPERGWSSAVPLEYPTDMEE